MEVKMMATVEVSGEAGPIELGVAKPRVVAVLLVNLGRCVSIERLVEEVRS